MSNEKLSPQQAYDVGMSRESWCAVELQKEQDWCRAERKHFKKQFNKSTVFGSTATAPSAEPRCCWQATSKTQSHREKRHFQNKYENKWKV